MFCSRDTIRRHLGSWREGITIVWRNHLHGNPYLDIYSLKQFIVIVLTFAFIFIIILDMKQAKNNLTSPR